MLLSEFDYYLPESLIAQHPPTVRGASRLLHVEGTHKTDLMFDDFLQQMRAGDVMVFNDTRVIKARLFGEKASGGQIEALIERVLDPHTALAHVRASKSPKPGTKLLFAGQWQAEMLERVGELFKLRFLAEVDLFDILEASGKLPLPPYIDRSAGDEDDERYQTVYARERGAVAAPTAGLHFTKEMLQRLENKGVKLCRVTLHADRLATIAQVDREDARVVDTHTADGIKVARQLRLAGENLVCLETALPAKFAETIREALHREPPRPAGFDGIEDLPQRVRLLPVDVAAVKQVIIDQVSG